MNHYQQLAMRTANLTEFSNKQLLTNAALGLAGEAGEFADAMKKHIFQGHELDRDALSKEVGDVLWYCALAASALGKGLADVAEDNIDKLLERYPNGFDADRSVNRSEQSA